ncbi:putative protein kinase UbiB [Trichinella pseudospiralis]
MKRPQILLHNNSNNADNRPMMPVASADVVCEADRQKPIHSFMEAYCRKRLQSSAIASCKIGCLCTDVKQDILDELKKSFEKKNGNQ